MTSRVGIAITVLGAVLLVTSSVAVSTVELERELAIEVDDESAVVGFERHTVAESAENGSSVELLNVTNNAHQSLDVRVDGGQGVDSIDSPSAGDGSIGSGKSTTITGTVACESGDSVLLDVTITGEGITIERTVAIDCKD